MALVLNQHTDCPHCGATSTPVRDSLYLFSEDDARTVPARDQLSPPSPLNLEPLSPRETLGFGVGLFAVLGVGIGPVIVLPFLMTTLVPSIMMMAAVWAIICPYMYLRHAETYLGRLYGDKALTRWNKLVYCATCRTVFIADEREPVSITHIHRLLYS